MDCTEPSCLSTPPPPNTIRSREPSVRRTNDCALGECALHPPRCNVPFPTRINVPDQIPHHVVQETRSRERYRPTLPPSAPTRGKYGPHIRTAFDSACGFLSRSFSRLSGAFSRIFLGIDGGERSEIVFARPALPPIHGLFIERVGIVPHVARHETEGRSSRDRFCSDRFWPAPSGAHENRMPASR
jgi:hypothetical protein